METEKIVSTLREVIMLASRLRNALNEFAPEAFNDADNEAADNAIDDAWELFEEADAELQAADADREPPDFEDLQALRDQRDYEAGKAQALVRRAERRIYGDALAESFHLQDDLNAYNRGEE